MNYPEDEQELLEIMRAKKYKAALFQIWDYCCACVNDKDTLDVDSIIKMIPDDALE